MGENYWILCVSIHTYILEILVSKRKFSQSVGELEPSALKKPRVEPIPGCSIGLQKDSPLASSENDNLNQRAKISDPSFRYPFQQSGQSDWKPQLTTDSLNFQVSQPTAHSISVQQPVMWNLMPHQQPYCPSYPAHPQGHPAYSQNFIHPNAYAQFQPNAESQTWKVLHILHHNLRKSTPAQVQQPQQQSPIRNKAQNPPKIASKVPFRRDVCFKKRNVN